MTPSRHTWTLFQSTLLMRGATEEAQKALHVKKISIHAPHARSDMINSLSTSTALIFQSTLLMRGATIRIRISPLSTFSFQSTLLMRGATSKAGRRAYRQAGISIHAPHARSDIIFCRSCREISYFNPRSSCEERLEQSTIIQNNTNFNPRSSCEERQQIIFNLTIDFLISIHAPHARSDSFQLILSTACGFQSTLLMRGATRVASEAHQLGRISIHAPHARSDLMEILFLAAASYISIHAPHARSDF